MENNKEPKESFPLTSAEAASENASVGESWAEELVASARRRTGQNLTIGLPSATTPAPSMERKETLPLTSAETASEDGSVNERWAEELVASARRRTGQNLTIGLPGDRADSMSNVR
jgi:hypothetical protein